ncbi:hypothetical protein A2U01_0106866, partial [Trifolium medium]|nr:hypothetical protein [Trifolium medium]
DAIISHGSDFLDTNQLETDDAIDPNANQLAIVSAQFPEVVQQDIADDTEKVRKRDS